MNGENTLHNIQACQFTLLFKDTTVNFAVYLQTKYVYGIDFFFLIKSKQMNFVQRIWLIIINQNNQQKKLMSLFQLEAMTN